MPFIDKRLNELKTKNIVSQVNYLEFRYSFFYKILLIILNKKQIFQEKTYSNDDWIPIIYKRSLIKLLLGKLKLYNEEKYISDKIYAELIIDKNIDLVHVHWGYPSGYYFYLIKKKYGIPYIVTLHGSDIHTYPFKDSLNSKKILKVLQNSKTSIFVSKTLLETAKKLGYSGENSTIIPNGYDEDIFYFEDKRNSKKKINVNSRFLIGFVGNLIDVKNVRVLPEIFKRVFEEVENIEFVLIGDGELKEVIKEEFEKSKIDVKFTGNIPQAEVGRWMRAMDIMILPSKNEGWPCVIKEAQASGTFVVGSAIGGIVEAVGKHGKTFTLDKNFEKNVSKFIIKKLEQLSDETIYHKSIVSYSWKNIVNRESNIYRDV